MVGQQVGLQYHGKVRLEKKSTSLNKRRGVAENINKEAKRTALLPAIWSKIRHFFFQSIPNLVIIIPNASNWISIRAMSSVTRLLKCIYIYIYIYI